MYLASSSNDQLRSSFEGAQESGYPHIPAFEIHIRIPVVSPGFSSWYYHREIMVWIVTTKVQVVFVSGPGIVDFVDPAVNIPYFTYMMIGMVCRNGYNLIPDWIIPVPVIGIHMPVFMVHSVGPGYMDPAWHTVMIIDFAVPDRIIMIALNMICTYGPPIGSGIMLAMLGMCPCNMLAFAGIASY